MYEFTYHRPGTLDEAVSLFESASDPSFLSGGHTLIPTMKNRLAAPDALIDLRDIPDLHGVSLDGDVLNIGAATTHFAVSNAAEVQQAIPTLVRMAGSIGDVQVRHVGTMGGSLANNDPAADYPCAALALKAKIRTNKREIVADDFFDGLFATALEEGEIIVSVGYPVPETAGYAKFRSQASRYAVAAVFVAKTGNDIRVSVTGAGNDGVFRWAAAEDALSANFEPAALDGLQPNPDDMMGDIHAGTEYRAHLVAVMARRAMENLGGALID